MTYDRSVQNQTVKQSVTLKKYYKYLINKMLMLNIVQKKQERITSAYSRCIKTNTDHEEYLYINLSLA